MELTIVWKYTCFIAPTSWKLCDFFLLVTALFEFDIIETLEMCPYYIGGPSINRDVRGVVC